MKTTDDWGMGVQKKTYEDLELKIVKLRKQKDYYSDKMWAARRELNELKRTKLAKGVLLGIPEYKKRIKTLKEAVSIMQDLYMQLQKERGKNELLEFRVEHYEGLIRYFVNQEKNQKSYEGMCLR